MVCTRALNCFTITPVKMIHITVYRGVKMNSKMVIEAPIIALLESPMAMKRSIGSEEGVFASSHCWCFY